jgi:transketolase
MSTLKPLDADAIVQAARETGAILTVEEHLRHGGLGSAVALVVGEQCPVPMAVMGIEDMYSKSGKPQELLQGCGLTATDIERRARELIARKNRS